MNDYRCVVADAKLDIQSRYKNSESHELEIKLNVSYSRAIYNWSHRRDSAAEAIRPGFFWNYEHDASAALAGKSLSRQSLRDALGISLGNYFHATKIDILADLVWARARRTLNPDSLPSSGVLALSCNIRTVHNHYYDVQSDRTRRMVPAAPSSFQLLEKCEVDCGRDCCSICLDEFCGGGGAVRMPCAHVFHGGCIEKWLRKSHCCPICRYRMPTE